MTAGGLLKGCGALGKVTADRDNRPNGEHMADERPNVVIVGAGFGGLEAAKALARAPVDVT